MGEFLVQAGFRVIAPSRPGFLNTPLNEANKTPNDQANLHAALMDKLGIEKFSVVCWSGGGPSSYTLASQHPERVTRLVTLAAVSKQFVFSFGRKIEDNVMVTSRFGKWLFNSMGKHSPKEVVKSIPKEEGSAPKDVVKVQYEYIWNNPVKKQFVLDIMGTLTGKERKAGLKNDEKQLKLIEDLGLSNIKTPTLLVHGMVDTDVPPEYSEYAHKHIPGSKLIHVKDGNHFAVWTDPTSDELQKQIIEFLKAWITGLLCRSDIGPANYGPIVSVCRADRLEFQMLG